MPSEIMRDWYIQKRKETEQQRQDAIASAARKKQSALGQNRTVQPVQKTTKTTPAKSIYQPEPVKNYTVAQPEDMNPQAKRNQAIDAMTSISESRLQRPTIMKETAPDRSAAFPSFSSGSLSPSRTVTSAFKEPASVSDRIDSFVKSVNPAEPAATTNDFLSAIMLENAADRREQAEALPGKIEQLNAEIEEARKAGDKEKLYALTREKMQLDFEQADSTLHRNTLLESILDAFGIGEENDGHQSVGEIFRTQEAQAQEKLMEGLSPGEQAAANLGVMGADMLANYGMSAMTGIPFAAYNAVTSGAATGEQALESGVDPDTALALAAGSGAISYGIEKVGGVAGDWGKQLLQKIGGTRIGQAVLSGLPQKAVQYISSLSGNKAAQVLGTGLEEGLENFTEYDLQRLWQNLILDEDTPFDVKQALSEAGAGILFGSTVAGINAAGDTVRQRQIGNELFETGEGLDLLAQGMESQSPSIRAEAERLARQSMEGQVSKTGLGQLYERMASGEESAVDVLLNAGRSGETPEAVMADALVNGPLKDGGGRKTPQYRILDYNDQESKQAITRQIHEDMVGRGKTVELTDADLQAFADYYPDLRSMKKSERTAILKEKKKQLIPAIKEMLHTMFDGQKVELSVNGSILEARVYNEGINHVSRNMSQEKAAMLRRSQDIFRQAEYLYSTGNDVHSTASSNPDIRQWHYFYVPLKLGDQTVGVRIAVRNMKTDNESQIYDWDIKKGRHTLDNGVTDSSTTPGVSSNASSFENSIPQTPGKVNPAEGQIPDPVGALAGAAPETEGRRTLADWLAGKVETGQTREEALRQQRQDAFDALTLREQELQMEALPEMPPETPENTPVSIEEQAELGRIFGESEPAIEETNGTPQLRLWNQLRKDIPLSGTQGARQEVQRALSPLIAELEATGTISKQTADSAFDTVYNNIVIQNTDWLDYYGALKKQLRQTKMFFPDSERSNIQDFEAFRKANFGNFTITKDPSAQSVDQVYLELSQMYPELFPQSITSPSEQLLRISEVSKSIEAQELDADTYYGEDAAEYRKFVRQQFDDALDELSEQMDRSGIWGSAETGPSPEQDYEENSEFLNDIDRGLVDDPEQVDILREAYRRAQELQAEAYPNEELTKQEQDLISALRKGTTDARVISEKLQDADRIDLVIRTAMAQRKLDEVTQPIRKYNAARLKQMETQAREATINSDLWKDKATGFQYQRETMERNIRDIVPNKAEAERIIDRYFSPVHEHEADRTRFLNEYRERVKKLGLTKKESQWVQMVGEGVKDLREIPLGMDPIKISNAVTELRDRIYPELYNQLSDSLMLNGYSPSGYIQNYFPHFNDPNDPITNALRTLGLNIDTRELPTSIAGITETFEPGKSFFANLLHREGNKTDYDALEGFDRYLEGVSNVIYHTEDIQNLRMLEQVIRDKYDRNKTGKQQINEITMENMPDDVFADTELDKRFASDASRLSKFITELHSYTDALAGKKNIGDRNIEHSWSRGIYSIANAMEKRVAANMVALNPGSWVNNLIPLTQGGMELSKTSLVQAMNQTMKSYLQADNFVDRSTFLTNRAGSRRVSQTGLEKATDFLSSPMQMIDLFTANVLVRGRYLDNIKSGMGETAAMREADKWAASVMADRSKGSLPTIFEKKNPFTRLFTMYQVEVNNQLSHLFKDLPREAKKKGVAWLAATLLEMGVAGWLCNQVYEAIFGRRPAADPIGVALDFSEDLQNENLSTTEALSNLGEEVLNQIPFTTALNLVGIDTAGRYPVEAAIPDVTGMISDALNPNLAANAKAERIGDELLKPIYYIVPPVAGGQAKKTIEGIQAAAQGGVYSTNSKGGQEMRYPVEGMDAVQAILFGPSSTQNARDYYRDFQPILPEGQEQTNEAKARSLPRIVGYSYGEAEDKVSGTVTLTGEEQRAYQDAFLALLPEKLENVPEEMQQDVYTYAEQLARDEALAEKGIDQYEPGSWVTKAKEAVDSGISIFDYLDIRDTFSDIEPVKDSAGKTTVTTTEQKRDALMSDTRLTPEQKRTIDILLIGGDEEKAADYTNENTYYRSLMSSADQARYDAVDSMTGGMDVNAFEELQTLVNAQKLPDETSLEKKNRVIQSIMDNGFSRRDAYGIWSALSASGADTLSGDREQDVLAALSDSAKQKYRDVSGYFYNLPVSDFAYIQDVLSSCQGIKDANGKTISGSLKEAKLSALQSLGMSWQEANVYYNLVS